MASVSRTYKRIARWYDYLDAPFEYGRYKTLRPLVFEGLRGKILDAGIGTGRNIPYYPRSSDVCGIDQSPEMLRLAYQRSIKSRYSMQLHEMDVTDTTFDDNTFDSVVSTFLFCVLDSSQQGPALKEMARICKPDGEVRLLEYCYSENPRKYFIMRLWSPWVRWAYAAAFDRNTKDYLDESGLTIISDSFVHGDIVRLIKARPN